MRLLTIVALAVCVAVSWTHQAAATDGLIHGCVDNKKGKLRVVSDPSECKSKETPLSWNQQGLTGDRGEPGDPVFVVMDNDPSGSKPVGTVVNFNINASN